MEQQTQQNWSLSLPMNTPLLRDDTHRAMLRRQVSESRHVRVMRGADTAHVQIRLAQPMTADHDITLTPAYKVVHILAINLQRVSVLNLIVL